MTEQNLVHTKFHTNLTTNQRDIVYMAFHLLLLLFVCFMKALGNCRQRGMNYRGICVQNWVEERKKASRKNEQRKTGQIDWKARINGRKEKRLEWHKSKNKWQQSTTTTTTTTKRMRLRQKERWKEKRSRHRKQKQNATYRLHAGPDGSLLCSTESTHRPCHAYSTWRHLPLRPHHGHHGRLEPLTLRHTPSYIFLLWCSCWLFSSLQQSCF